MYVGFEDFFLGEINVMKLLFYYASIFKEIYHEMSEKKSTITASIYSVIKNRIILQQT